MNVPNYNQWDPKWSNVQIPSPAVADRMNLGNFGCAITCVAAFLTHAGIPETPPTVLAKLKDAGGFNEYGEFYWGRVAEAWGVTFLRRVYTVVGGTPNMAGRKTMAAAKLEVLRLVELGQPVLVNVDNIGHDGLSDHWVLVHDYADGKFVIMNPDGGKTEAFDDKYGDPEAGMFGYAVLVAPTGDVPAWSKEGPESAALQKAAEVARLAKSLPDGRLRVLASEIVETLL